MNQKVEELARTLVQSGIAASESEAKRMAEEMVSTESKVQEDFDDKREKETMYGATPRHPKREGQGELNHNNNNPRPLSSDVKVNPVDGTPITPPEEQKPRENVGMVKVENPHMTPEEYSASQLNVAKSTSELIEEENMNSDQSKNQDEPLVHESNEVNQPENKAEDLVIPKPDDPVAEEPEQEKKELPNLNPLEDSQSSESTISKEDNHQTTSEEVTSSQDNADQSSEKPKMTPEEYTASNNRSVGSDGKDLPQTQTPERPQKSKEELEKMEESKVDLTKIFKV